MIQKIPLSQGAMTAALTLALFQPVAWGQSPAQPASGAGMASKSMDMKGMDGKGMDGKGMDGKGMDMKAMMGDMNEKMMGMKSSGNADVDFAMMMRVHHQGAITMAEEELKSGKDAKMRAMAKDIIRAQKKEIAKFDAFLAKNESPMKPSK